jgi:hypothetical protein
MPLIFCRQMPNLYVEILYKKRGMISGIWQNKEITLCNNINMFAYDISVIF